MSYCCRVILPADLDEILNFETLKLAESLTDDTERTLASWHARWRRESLEHYLPLGWSFLVRDQDIKNSFAAANPGEGALVGYFLAQPFLFVEALTQTLWLEHMSFSSLQARDELCDLAYRVAREKHFQRVIFPNQSGISNSLASLKPEPWSPQSLSLSTSKIST